MWLFFFRKFFFEDQCNVFYFHQKSQPIFHQALLWFMTSCHFLPLFELDQFPNYNKTMVNPG